MLIADSEEESTEDEKYPSPAHARDDSPSFYTLEWECGGEDRESDDTEYDEDYTYTVESPLPECREEKCEYQRDEHTIGECSDIRHEIREHLLSSPYSWSDDTSEDADNPEKGYMRACKWHRSILYDILHMIYFFCKLQGKILRPY